MRAQKFSVLRFFSWRLVLLCLLCVLSASSGTGEAASLPAGVQSFAPMGRVADNVSFRLVFKNPMVPKSATGRAIGSEDFPFTVTPSIQAEGKWINERTFTARLLAPLKMATAYTAALKEGLTDRQKRKIGAGTFRFQTDALAPTDIKAVRDNDSARFTLSFNMRVDPGRLRGFLRVLNEQGREVPCTINGSLPSRAIQVSVPLQQTTAAQKLTVRIAAGLTPGEGDLGLSKDYSRSVVFEPELMLEELSGEEKAIRLSFNFDVDPEAAKEFISIEPNEKFTVESTYNASEFLLRGDFKPRNRFVVTLRRGLPSKQGGLVLKQEVRQAVIMPDLESQVSLPASGTYLAAVGGGAVPLELVNVKKLQIDLWRLYENNIPYVIRGDYNNFQKNLARRVYSKEYELSLPLNERVRRSLPVLDIVNASDDSGASDSTSTSGGKSGKRGLFLLTARDTEREWWYEESQLVSLSDLGAVARVWEDGILLWVNTLSSTEAVADATVRVYSEANQVVAEGRTDAQGIFFHERRDPWGSEDEQPRLAVISKGNDLTYVQLTRSLLNREIFDTAGRPWLRKGYDAILFSPRGVYRTGESVPVKAVVRESNIYLPMPFPVLFVVRDPLGRKFSQEAVELNSEGAALLTLDLPANAQTGLWTVSLVIPGGEDRPLASYNFHVEDFAPPRIEVKLDTAAKRLTHNDVFEAGIHARWLFGVDGAGLPYRTSWTAQASDFIPTKDRWKGYAFGDPSRVFSRLEGEIGENALDNTGSARTSLKLEAPWEAATTIALTLRAEVMEDGGRWVSNSVTRTYFPAPWLLGIAPVDESMAVRRDLTFRVAAVDPDENPADPGELTAALYRVVWNYNMVEVDGHRRWQSSEELLKISEKNFTVSDGLGSVTFRPEEWGSYLVRVSDGDDNARAVCRFFADDPQYAGHGGSRLLDRVDITMDRESYKVGDTAKITLRVPFEGLLMLNVEGAKLISREIHKIENSEAVFEVPVTSEMVPNAWVTAWLIRPVREDETAWGGHRAVGLARLKTDLSGYRLDVALDAPDKTAPAAVLPVTLTLRDSNGEPAHNADAALALVDEAVLKLTGYRTPDLLNHFWGLRELGSKGYDLYDLLIPVESRATEPLHPSGGMALAALAGGSEGQRFKLLSLFQGSLSADENGVIKTELTLPEFSGRGRLFAVVSSGNRFGLAEQPVQIARSVVTEAGLPRFAAPGDVFTAPVTVFNTSDEDREIKISLSAQGALKPRETQKILKVRAGGQAQWSTEVQALDLSGASHQEGSETAVWSVTTSWTENGGQKEFTQEIELPIRSPWPVVTRSGSGTFEAGGTGTKIHVPLDRFSGKVSGGLTLADTPAADLTQAVAYLSNYPYGCLEQTLSSAWPFLILPDAVAEADPLLVNNRAVRDRTEKALARLQAMQLYDGSFEMWPGSGRPYEWGSVYAAHFLIEARNAGLSFPEDMLNGVMNWLKQYMASMPAFEYPTEEKDDFTTKAYGAYVLTLSGERPLGWLEYLRENQSSMWPSGRIWLAGAQSLLDGRADALRELGTGNAAGSEITPEARWRTLESDVRNEAVLLSLWLDVEPQAQEAVELAARLMKQSQDGRWYGTQDNAAALMALARYNLRTGGGRPALTGTLTGETDGGELLAYRSGKAASVPLSKLPSDGRLLLDVQGTGRGCYAWTVTGAPNSQPKAERRGINIERVWLDERGAVLDLSKPVPQGKRIQVLLTLRPSLPVNSLAVSCLLPAGLELENPRLDDGLEPSAGSYGVIADVRDDRLTLFFDRLEGEQTYGFKVRAVTKGTFAVPPLSAAGMYDPAVRMTGGSQAPLVIE